MTHVKHAEAFARLVDFCTGYGGTYNPGRPTLQIEALSTQKQEANQALTKVINAKALYDNEVNQRWQVFDQLPKLVSSILRTLEASGASPEKLKDARSFANQIIGNATSKSTPRPMAKGETLQPGSDPIKVKHSMMQLAYSSKADAFAKLVKAVETEPLYLSNEAHLNSSGLSEKVNQVNALSQGVSGARVEWSNARIDRNQVLYEKSQSVVNIGRAVKKYVRAIFGHDSDISFLNFYVTLHWVRCTDTVNQKNRKLKKSAKKKIALFYRYLTRIGYLKGLILFIKFHVLGIQWGIKVPMLKQLIYMRKRTSDLTTFDQIFLTGIYKLPAKFNPKVIIDCGANIGMATVYFANKFPNAKIVAIEPELSNYEILVRNSKAYPNVVPIQKAVWHTSGKLQIVDTGKGNYAFMVKEEVSSEDKVVSSIDAISLTDIIRDYGWNIVDFIKMDVEGAEKFIFSHDCDEWLSKTNGLSIELHENIQPGTSKVIVKALARHDFAIAGSFEGYLCFK